MRINFAYRQVFITAYFFDDFGKFAFALYAYAIHTRIDGDRDRRLFDEFFACRRNFFNLTFVPYRRRKVVTRRRFRFVVTENYNRLSGYRTQLFAFVRARHGERIYRADVIRDFFRAVPVTVGFYHSDHFRVFRKSPLKLQDVGFYRIEIYRYYSAHGIIL
ncbi:unknown [Acidiphilium sp. CAG:727]|nr:unknown [Acidiphilium sp. CAG:727]